MGCIHKLSNSNELITHLTRKFLQEIPFLVFEMYATTGTRSENRLLTFDTMRRHIPTFFDATETVKDCIHIQHFSDNPQGSYTFVFTYVYSSLHPFLYFTEKKCNNIVS